MNDLEATNRRQALALLVGSIAVAAGPSCAATLPPLTLPDQGGASWTELTSAHFRLRTDVDRDAAERTLRDMEASHAALAVVMRRAPKAVEPLAPVVLFARQRDIQAIGAQFSVGFFRPHVPGGSDGEGVIVLSDSDQPAETRATLQHELTHRFLFERYGATPMWLSEGLAEYYSSLRVDDDRIVLGGPASVDFADRGRHSDYWLASIDGRSQVEVPRYDAPALAALLEANRASFYGAPDDTSRAALRRRAVNYAASWRLVHLLLNGPGARYRASFVSFLEALGRGRPPRDAFAAAFGQDLAQLEADYRAYLREPGPPLVTARMALPPSPLAPFQVRPMSSDEVGALWASLKAPAER